MGALGPKAGGALASAAAIVACAVCVPTAAAVLPSDPAASSQETLAIIELSTAVDHLARVPVDIPVLVADTGLDLDHPDLAPRLFSLPTATKAPCQSDGVFPGGCAAAPTIPAGAAGWDMIGNENNCAPPNEKPDNDPTDPVTCSGHGTLVAGVLGAAWNGVGGIGVAPNARFIALRTCWDGDNCYGHIQPVAFDWATDAGARVVSMSWLYGAAPAEPGFAAVIQANPQTLFVAIPSGNGGAYDVDAANETPFPCSLNAANVLCVSTSASNGGLDCGGYGANTVDIAVPTRNSVTTTKDGGFAPTDCFTSYASPLAAGLATLLFGIVPEATAAQVKKAILDGATPSAAWRGKSVSGGVLNARGAVDQLQATFGLKPPENILTVVASAKNKLPGDKLKVAVNCSLACEVVAQAKGKAGKQFSSKQVRRSLPAGVATTLKLPLSARAERKIDGEKGKATIVVSATAAGQSAGDVEPVKIKP